jgi:hypothetical protein
MKQINEFGQAPRQLFNCPHPSRPERKKGSVRTYRPTDLNKHSGKFGGLSTNFLSQIMAVASQEHGSKFSPGNSGNTTPRTPSAQLTPGQSPGRKSFDDTAEIEEASCSGESDGLESITDRSEAEDLEEQLVGEDLDALDRYGSGVASTPAFEDPYSPFDIKEESLPPDISFDVVRNVELQLNLENRASRLSELKLSTSRPAIGLTPSQKRTSECSTSGSKGTRPWHWMFRQRLSVPQAMKLHRGPVNALALSAENASESLTMYSVGKDGFIKASTNSKGGLHLLALLEGHLRLGTFSFAETFVPLAGLLNFRRFPSTGHKARKLATGNTSVGWQQ